MEDLVFILVEACGCGWEDVRGKSRKQRLCIVRQLVWRILRELGMSWEEIGTLFYREHSSVILGVKHIEDLLSVGDEYVCEMKRKMEDELNGCS